MFAGFTGCCPHSSPPLPDVVWYSGWFCSWIASGVRGYAVSTLVCSYGEGPVYGVGCAAGKDDDGAGWFAGAYFPRAASRFARL